MKKLILVASALLALNAMAQEVFVGAGWDFYRHGSNNKLEGTSKYRNNAKLRLEWFPYESDDSVVKAGIGISHDFGTKAKRNDGSKVRLGNATPVYFALKEQVAVNDNTNWYAKQRLGWSFNTGKNGHSSGTYAYDSKYKSGPMAGLETGFEFGPVALGLTYDAVYVSPDKGKQNKGTINHQLGMQVGYVFGGKKVTPTIAPTPIISEPVIEIPVVEDEEEPVVIQKQERRGIQTIHFEFDHPEVDIPSERRKLDQTINMLNEAEYVDVEVSGHTDSKGSDAYNDKLGQKRADNVANEIRQRTDSSKVNVRSSVSEGERNPIDTNETDAGRFNNRRAEIHFKGWFDGIEEQY